MSRQTNAARKIRNFMMPYASRLAVSLTSQLPFDGIDLGLPKRDFRHSPDFTKQSLIRYKRFTECKCSGKRYRPALHSGRVPIRFPTLSDHLEASCPPLADR